MKRALVTIITIVILSALATPAFAQHAVVQWGIAWPANGPCSPLPNSVGVCGDDPQYSGQPTLTLYDGAGKKYTPASLQGQTGATGPQGQPGATGPAGATGATGLQGAT